MSASANEVAEAVRDKPESFTSVHLPFPSFRKSRVPAAMPLTRRSKSPSPSTSANVAPGTRLFLNDGKGKWTEVKDSGLSRTASATSLALADIDGDGDLDLYCTHYIDVMHLSDPTIRFALARRGDQWEVTKVNGESSRLPQWKDRFEALPDGKVRELPEGDGLYRNDGHGHFTPIQFEPGVFTNEEGKPIPPYRDWGLAVMFRDLNGDGIPDLYVCNDNVSPDRILINLGRGTFPPIDLFAFRHTSRSSMGGGFGGIDTDGPA